MNKDLETIQFNIKCQCSYYKNILNFFDSYYSSENFVVHEDPFLRTLKFCFTKNDFFCYKNPLKLENISSLVYTKPSLENLYMNPDIKCKTIEKQAWFRLVNNYFGL